MTQYQGGRYDMSNTSQFIAFMQTATGHRPEPRFSPAAVKRVIAFAVAFLLAVGSMAFALIELTTGGVNIAAHVLPILALVIGGAMTTCMAYLVTDR